MIIGVRKIVFPFAENLPSAISAIKEAMEEWQKKTCIRFVNHTNEKDYLTFFRDNRYYSK